MLASYRAFKTRAEPCERIGSGGGRYPVHLIALTGSSVRMLSVLLAPRDTQRRLEPVTDKGIDAGDVGRREPAGDIDHGPELTQRRAAACASGEMLLDAAPVVLVHRAVEVGGDAFDKLDAAQILCGSERSLTASTPFLRSIAPGVRAPDRALAASALAPARVRGPGLRAPRSATVPRRREGP